MHPVVAIVGLMLLTWIAAIWASFREEPDGDAWYRESRNPYRKAS